jgi:7-keto-8-aminopelargonate synthetase-like enzyme
MKKKTNYFDFINVVNEIIEKGRKQEVLQLYTEDEVFDGRFIHIKGKRLLNFGSCSYLGLEIEQRLKAAAIDAIQRYGIQYSTSRSYVSCTLYKELEDLIGKIFDAPILLTPTITLGHQAVIPIVVESGDVIILDQQVHASVQYAANNMQLKGIGISVIRHNNMEELEMAINKLDNCNRIWYMADGIYSMYGDYAPIKELETLLNRYPKLHLYMDDAHGMSWTGKSGRGFVLSQMKMHPRMIVGTSFAKGFGTGGGAFVFNDPALCQKVKNCGGPLIFSGPNQVPVIAASIASAKIHLSPEIITYQSELKKKLLYCHQLMLKHGLPVTSNPETPIKFIGLGLARMGYNMVKRMMDEGFYCNLAIFPAVPETCTGLRFTITLHHTYEDIKALVTSLAYHLPKALLEEGRTMEDIHRAFRKSFKQTEEPIKLPSSIEKYRIQHETTIDAIPEKLWNTYLGKDSSFDWNWIKFLERTFKNNDLPENNWDFHYYIIRDIMDKPVCITFFTVIINKDDIFSPRYVSHQLELTRKVEPYYLCSETLMMGSILTDGEHLYIDRSTPDWTTILMLLLDAVWKEQDKNKISSLCLRDFSAGDIELQNFFSAQGFLTVNLPDSHVIERVSRDSESFLKQFNSRERWYLKDNVLKYEPLYTVEIVQHPSEQDVEIWYELYKNVKNKSFDLNTFDLPKRIFENMALSVNCEIMQLKVKTDGQNSKVVSVTFNIVTASNNYCGIIIGLDYDYLKSHGVYKQTLYTSILRAGQLKTDKMFLGFTASEVKKKFGAKVHPQVAYLQMQDHYSLSVINAIPNTNV